MTTSNSAINSFHVDLFWESFEKTLEMKSNDDQFESPAVWVLIVTYFNYGILTIFGWFRDILRFYGIEKTLG